MPNQPVSRRNVLAAGVAVLSGAAGCGGRLFDAEPTSTSTTESSPSPESGSASGENQTAVPERYVDVYRQHVDSVVSVRAVGSAASGQGSGFVYDESHLITNEHVVRTGDRVYVQYRTGAYEVADVVGTDVLSDLAVLEVTERPDAATPLSAVGEEVAVGTETVALGTPFGLEESLTTGVVSGRNRLLTIQEGVRCPDVIQTDAAVNPGNSGGPLLTLDGDLLGVVTATGGQNLSLVVSSRILDSVVPGLVADGAYDHPFLGVELANLPPPVAEANDRDSTRGALVLRVVGDGPVDGLLHGSRSETRDGRTYPVGGDVIGALDGDPVGNVEAYARRLALEYSPGDEVSVRVDRDGEDHTVRAALGTRDETSW